jgi:probable metal-binding protein
MKQIHGHEVMQMMLESGKTYSRASLLQDTRFHTCSAENLGAEELITLLEAKGKFLPFQDGFQTSPDLMCKH